MGDGNPMVASSCIVMLIVMALLMSIVCVHEVMLLLQGGDTGVPADMDLCRYTHKFCMVWYAA